MFTKAKFLHWLKRYGPAEISGTIAVYIAFFTVEHFSSFVLAAGVIGAWAENLGFYSVIFYQRMKDKKNHKNKRKMLTDMLAEFGPAEVLDSFFLRPICLVLGANLLGPELGVLIGKICGDVLFYIPVIATYEVQQRWHRSKQIKASAGLP